MQTNTEQSNFPLENIFSSSKLEIVDPEESDSDVTGPYDLSDHEDEKSTRLTVYVLYKIKKYFI